MSKTQTCRSPFVMQTGRQTTLPLGLWKLPSLSTAWELLGPTEPALGGRRSQGKWGWPGVLCAGQGAVSGEPDLPPSQGIGKGSLFYFQDLPFFCLKEVHTFRWMN